MKLKRKIIALAMAATFTISMVSTAFADTPPHLMYGTEKTYGEESTQHKPLYQDEYDPSMLFCPKLTRSALKEKIPNLMIIIT